MLSKTARRRTGGRVARAGILLAIVLGHAALIVVTLERSAKTTRARPLPTVAWVTLPTLHPAVVLPPVGTTLVVPDARERPLPVSFVPVTFPSWSDQPIVVWTAPRFARNPCARPPNPSDAGPPDPSCAVQTRAAPPAPLDLPDSLQQDAFGNIAPNAGSLFARVPPDPPEQARLDADKHYAALVEIFGPPYAPAKVPWADNPSAGMEKGPLIQFIEDRLASAPLTPQSTLRQ